jgi:hypothetical protein
MIVFLAVIVTAVLYDERWRACCSEFDTIVAVLLSPGFLIAIVVGGGVHASSKSAFYFGVVVQFLVMWWLFRLILRKFRKQDEGNNAKRAE